jgi:hypothetical protein
MSTRWFFGFVTKLPGVVRREIVIHIMRTT